MRSSLAVPAAAAAFLAKSALKAKTESVSPLEEEVFRRFNEAPDHLHLPAWAVMQSGSLAAVVVGAGELARRNRRTSASLALVVGFLVWLGVKAAKPAIGRGRPSAHLEHVSVRGHEQSGLGYPSGHAAVALTLALIATRGCGPAVRLGAVTAAGCTGAARMYVGAHLPLDVVGGLSLGALFGWATVAASRNLPLTGYLVDHP